MSLDHLSWSSLTDAGHCLTLFAQRLGPPIPELLDEPRDTGTLVHKMQQLHLHAVARGVNNPEARAHEALCALPRLGYVYQEAKGLFTAWVGRFDIPPDKWLGVERYGRCSIEGVPLPIDGFDDIVYRDGTGVLVVIRDFKSGRSSEITPEYAFQGDLACERYLAQHPGSIVDWEIEFLRSGIVTQRTSYTAQRQAATRARVQALWGAIASAMDSGQYPRTAGKWCGWCPDLARCTVGQQARAQKLIIADEQSAKDAVLLINMLKATQQRLTANLKGYVDAKGSVSAGGLTADFQATQSLGIKDIDEVIRRKGIDVAVDALALGDKRKKAVKELMSDPELRDLVVVTSRSNRFNPGIKGADEDDDDLDA